MEADSKSLNQLSTIKLSIITITISLNVIGASAASIFH